MVTKQKTFNKSMIDKATQVIFLDEAYAKLLDPDDWKVRPSLCFFVVFMHAENESMLKRSSCLTLACCMDRHFIVVFTVFLRTFYFDAFRSSLREGSPLTTASLPRPLR